MISTDINYPSGLPRSLRANHGVTAVASPFNRTAMQSGRAVSRRMFKSVPTQDTYEWRFTDPEAALFEAWFRDILNEGVEWFNMPRKTPLARQQILVCRFVTMYSGPNLVEHNRWSYSAVLETWERPLLAPGSGNFPDYILRAGLLDIIVNEQWPLPLQQP